MINVFLIRWLASLDLWSMQQRRPILDFGFGAEEERKLRALGVGSRGRRGASVRSEPQSGSASPRSGRGGSIGAACGPASPQAVRSGPPAAAPQRRRFDRGRLRPRLTAGGSIGAPCGPASPRGGRGAGPPQGGALETQGGLPWAGLWVPRSGRETEGAHDEMTD